ncbi:retrotransposon gag domain-containing protein, partial [Lactobacillus salivarius]|nr:retrotransposon gag domain-containing protein [Ligilactobacillus salivarius]
DSWDKCKDAYISKYFPPAKIISLRNDIMNFKQLDHEHVAQSWERMKLMIRNCPAHGLSLWMIIQIFYAGLNFASRNILDSASGGTFMEITLGDATKLLDNIMTNYSQWHTERS